MPQVDVATLNIALQADNSDTSMANRTIVSGTTIYIAPGTSPDGVDTIDLYLNGVLADTIDVTQAGPYPELITTPGVYVVTFKAGDANTESNAITITIVIASPSGGPTSTVRRRLPTINGGIGRRFRGVM